MSDLVDREASGAEGSLPERMQKAGPPVKHPKDKKPEAAARDGQAVQDGSAKRNIARKSRDPEKDKRQGGGHKGFWSKTDDGTEGAVTAIDHDDPNYDSSEDAEVIMVDGDGGRSPPRKGYAAGSRRAEGDLMPLSEFKARVSEVITEYFVSEDQAEVKRSLAELDSPLYHYEVVKRAISMALDKKEREKELVSRLLSYLYPNTISTDQLGKGFERLFETVDDLQLDAPSATRDIATFLARAVVDEILPPSFLSDPLVVGLGGEVVEHAKLLLSRDHMGARLEHIWGPGDGRSVPELKVAIDQLLQEYLLSRQLEEAARCVRELSVPHFHHEIVKRGVVLALDKPPEDRTAMASLLTYLFANEVVSSQQITKGFKRLYAALPDLQLDVPAAPAVLKEFLDQARSDGCLPSDYATPSEAAGGKAAAPADS